MVSPPSKLSDWEKILWGNVSEKLDGKVVSLDELKDLFSTGEKTSEVRLVKEDNSLAIYGRESASGIVEYIAYQCKHCDTLMIGSPGIRDNNSLKKGMPLTGKDGYDRVCRSCYAHLGSVSLEVR